MSSLQKWSVRETYGFSNCKECFMALGIWKELSIERLIFEFLLLNLVGFSWHFILKLPTVFSPSFLLFVFCSQVSAKTYLPSTSVLTWLPKSQKNSGAHLPLWYVHSVADNLRYRLNDVLFNLAIILYFSWFRLRNYLLNFCPFYTPDGLGVIKLSIFLLFIS